MDDVTVKSLERVAREYPHVAEILWREREELRPLRDENEEEYERAFLLLILRTWKERWASRRLVNEEEFFWWLSLIMIARFPENSLLRVLKATVEANWSGSCEWVERLKREGALPEDATLEEHLAQVFDFPRIIVRPGNQYLRALGFPSKRAFDEQSGEDHLVQIAELIRTGDIGRVFRAAFITLRSTFRRRSARRKGNVSLDNALGSLSVVNVIQQFEDTLFLDQLVAESRLSSMEVAIVDGIRSCEVPPPGQRAKYGDVRLFCAERRISYKGFYVARARALTKLRLRAARIS